jgi:nucleoside-diphosphate-sugar epimerase
MNFSENGRYQQAISLIAHIEFIPWYELRGKKILITGATGLICSFLIDILMFRNKIFDDYITIFAIGRNVNKARARFNDYFYSENFIFLQQDIQLPVELVGKVDYIIHGASNTHPVAYAMDPINTILLSIIGTKNILDLAASQKAKRTIFLSTVEIYGQNRGDVDQFKEEYCGYIDSNTLRAGYPEGKRAAEALCQAYIKEKNIDVVIARCCRVYGPTMGTDDSKAIAQFIRCAVKNENIILKSNGEQEYSYCYVADVCTAIIILLTRGEKGEAYNIADINSNITLYQIARMLSDYIKKSVMFEIPSAIELSGYSKATKALLNNSKLKNLGWEAKYAIEYGLIETIEILKSLK